MRVLEFFSGIGGWRCALNKHPEYLFEVVQSFDINTAANQVYELNFNCKPSPKCINSLTKQMLDKYRADLWCMSPPCQPYTRSNTSAKRDADDQRSNALLHLLLLLREVHFRPRYILLENVVGFENSDCCLKVLETLAEKQYQWAEFILTPTQFDIPNSRPRYYLLACLDHEQDLGVEVKEGRFSELWMRVARSSLSQDTVEGGGGHGRHSILHELPGCVAGQQAEAEGASSSRSLSEWLEPPSFDDSALLVPLDVLLKPSSWCFDIVTPVDSHTACFTKAYTRYAKGTGSVLSTAGWAAGSLALPTSSSSTKSSSSSCKRPRVEEDEGREGQKKCLTQEQISSLRLRYFSPEELLRLFGFPLGAGFRGFPADVSRKKAYELIGNSLNVDVAGRLVHFLLHHTGCSGSPGSSDSSPALCSRIIPVTC